MPRQTRPVAASALARHATCPMRTYLTGGAPDPGNARTRAGEAAHARADRRLAGPTGLRSRVAAAILLLIALALLAYLAFWS